MVPLFKPYMPEKIESEVAGVLHSGKLAFGANGRQLEQELAKWLGAPGVVAVNSFGSAMELLLNLYKIGPQDDVIMSPMGCLRSSQPVICCGARIIWADIDPLTGTLCPESVRQKITSQTKLIFNYHHLGYLGYTEELNQIGQEYGIPVVEDCLDGLGGVYKGHKAGTCGKAAVISFDAVRLPNAIEGAALVLQDPELLAEAMIKRDLGVDRFRYRDQYNEINPDCDIEVTGYACTLNEVNASIALAQMSELDQLLAIRRKNAVRWKARLSGRNDCQLLSEVAGTEPSYWVFGLLTDHKIDLLKQFRAEGFFASGIHFPNNLYSVFGKEACALPGVQEFYRRFLALPCGWWYHES